MTAAEYNRLIFNLHSLTSLYQGEVSWQQENNQWKLQNHIQVYHTSPSRRIADSTSTAVQYCIEPGAHIPAF